MKIKQILLMITFSVVFINSGNCQLNKNKISISLDQYQTPVLIRKENNPVLRICIDVPDQQNQVSMKEISLSLEGTNDLKDIASVKVFYTESDSALNTSIKFGQLDSPAQYLKLRGNQSLKSGKNYFWVSVKLEDDASLLNRVNAHCLDIRLNNRINLKPVRTSPALTQRIGIALRKHDDDGVHTYRIPGLTTSKNGTLLAVYDVRRNSSRDLQGDIDIGLSRSTDGGQNWEPMKIILDKDSWGDLPEKYNGISDACILADQIAGDIFVSGLWMYGVLDKNGQWMEGLDTSKTAWNHQWRNKGSQPGFNVKQTSQFLLTRSTDDGKTWGKPVNLTKALKKQEWWLFAPSPGSGITMNNGILVFPTQGRDEKGLPFSNITFSNDHGKSWETSNPAFHNTTENSVIQLSDGLLMLNMRDNRNRSIKGKHNGRAVFVTSNMGETWTEHPTSHHALQEPVCMASLIRFEYNYNGEKKVILLFSNPDDQFNRKNLTIKASRDNGMTWPSANHLLLDAGSGRGYSSLTQIDNETIGILYEGSQADMVFEKIHISEVLKGQ